MQGSFRCNQLTKEVKLAPKKILSASVLEEDSDKEPRHSKLKKDPESSLATIRPTNEEVEKERF